MKIKRIFFIRNFSERETRALIISESVFFQTDRNFRKRYNPKIPTITVMPEIKIVKLSYIRFHGYWKLLYYIKLSFFKNSQIIK